MAKRPIQQGSAQPVVVYDPAQKKILEGSATPVAFFDANGVATSFVGGDNGEIQYNNNGAIDGATDIVISDGAIQMNNDATVWDDLQISLTRAQFPGVDDPTWRSYDFGLGGTTYQVLGFAVDDFVNFYVQTQHAMQLNTALDFHIHWVIPSDSAGDRIKFEIDIVSAGVDEDFAVPTGSPYSAEHLMDGTEAGHHNLLDIADIAAVNTTVSTLYVVQFKRVDASANEYANEVYVLYADCHFIKNTMGSRTELTK